jgi:hypothetical protein
MFSGISNAVSDLQCSEALRIYGIGPPSFLSVETSRATDSRYTVFQNFGSIYFLITSITFMNNSSSFVNTDELGLNCREY